MGRRIKLSFRDAAQGELFHLSYALLENSFQERWIATLLVDNPESQPLQYVASGALFVDEAKERSELDQKIRELESDLQTELVKTPLRKFATAADFVPLKTACFELLNTPVGLRGRNSKTQNKISGVIQAIIHYESLYDPDHHFQCDLKIQNERRYFFKESEYDLFTIDRRDGWLYLDYGQKGLAPISAYLSASNELPTPQNSFIGNFQIVYREDFSYSDDEKVAAEAWLHKRLNRSNVEKKDQLGQIPLGRPLHSFSRIEVLNRLLNFQGQVSLEIWDGDRELSTKSLKHELKHAARSLRPYHPYRPGSLDALFFQVETRWLRPIHEWTLRVWGKRWILTHRIYLPLKRKVKELFWDAFHFLRHTLRHFVFKASWPLRKVYYIGEHAIKTRILKKKN